MVFLEDLRNEISGPAKVAALVTSRLLPLWVLQRLYRHGKTTDSTATVIFSSGSTGVPKGVVLSHANVLANVDSLDQIFPMDPSDCFIGVLPFFHSFGFTGTLWFPLVTGFGEGGSSIRFSGPGVTTSTPTGGTEMSTSHAPRPCVPAMSLRDVFCSSRSTTTVFGKPTSYGNQFEPPSVVRHTPTSVPM